MERLDDHSDMRRMIFRAMWNTPPLGRVGLLVFGPPAVFYLAVLPWLQLAGLSGHTSRVFLLWVWLLAGQALAVGVVAMIAASLLHRIRDLKSWLQVVAYAVFILVVSVSGTLGGFAQTYLILFGGSRGDFSPALTPMRAAFYTWGTFMTTGSGIVAQSPGAQVVTIVQMIVDIFLLVFAVAYVVANLRFTGRIRTPPGANPKRPGE
jgi:hypothetical protein